MAVVWDEQFRERLAAQASLTDSARLLAETATAMGWDRAAFQPDREATRLPRADDGQFVAEAMGWSADYVSEWLKLDLGRRCPVIQQCGRICDAFVWESDPAGATWRGRALLPEQCRVLDFYRDCADGAVTVPVHRPDGRTGYVSWFLRDGRALAERFQQTYRATFVISHAFIRHLDRLLLEDSRGRLADKGAGVLTARELECLGWAARGKTEEDIGLILGRSRETVHFHLQNAMHKLAASNRTHAVAIACSHGLITVL